MQTRQELLARLNAGECPPVLIIGGGINGVGTFRDLAAQGQAALLVEAGDFSSGTSSAPSRLIHGGLRYLETGEAALVRESLTERNLLLKNACHVVHPQTVWVPLDSWFRGSLMAVLRFLHLTRTPGPKGGVPVKLADVYDQNREQVTWENVSQFVKEAAVAGEGTGVGQRQRRGHHRSVAAPATARDRCGAAHGGPAGARQPAIFRFCRL